MNRRQFLSLSGAAVAATSLYAAGKGGSTVTIVEFDDAGNRKSSSSVEKTVKTDAQWKEQLTAEQFQVSRKAGTERSYSGKTWDNHKAGIYRCVGCETALFDSKTKFESGTGWPSFWQPIAKENVLTTGDNSIGMSRTEVKCARCDGHLGHVFDDGPPPTHLRYCMNSASMNFHPKA